MASEDIKIPEWPMRYTSAENGYSSQLTIDVPDDATLTWFDDGKEVRNEKIADTND